MYRYKHFSDGPNRAGILYYVQYIDKFQWDFEKVSNDDQPKML